MKNKIAILPGDGIGPEVMNQAMRVLKILDLDFHLNYADIGGSSYDKYNCHLTEDTIDICKNCDAILLGSVGGPVEQSHLDKWKNCEINSILKLRKIFSFNINIRPLRIYPDLKDISPIKNNLLPDNGIDILIFRELNGGSYFGKHEIGISNGKKYGYDIDKYDEDQIIKIADKAFQIARDKQKKIISVDKANVLSSSKIWREKVDYVAKKYPNVKYEHMLIDNCAMQMVKNISYFDIILTSNLFGDILSDLGAGIAGSLGFMSSASINNQGFGLYEPAGGSAPDIAGKNIANPVAQILSLAMLLRFSFDLGQYADDIEKAVLDTLKQGYRTKDLFHKDQPNNRVVNTEQMTDIIIKNMKNN